MKKLIAAAALLIAAAAFAQPRPPRIERDLNLTAEQQTAFDNARHEFEHSTMPLIEKERDARERVADAVRGGNTDACALGQMLLDSRNIGDQLKSAHDAFTKKLSMIFTPDQMAKFESFEKQMRMHGPPPDAPR